MTDEPAPTTIPAATLILFREDAQGVAEHLFVERASTMASAAGAIVFPGGRVDPGDRMMAARFASFETDDCAGRVAAIRETIEEAGLGIGLKPVPRPEQVDRVRAGLSRGGVFADLLASERLDLDLDCLVPFARWLPKHRHMRIFDTRFYVARANPSLAEARVDQTENVRTFWASAQSVLDQADAGSVRIIYPTRRNLERLAGLRSFDRAVVQTLELERSPVIVTPWIEDRAGVRHLVIRDDAGYPITAEALSDAFRG